MKYKQDGIFMLGHALVGLNRKSGDENEQNDNGGAAAAGSGGERLRGQQAMPRLAERPETRGTGQLDEGSTDVDADDGCRRVDGVRAEFELHGAKRHANCAGGRVDQGGVENLRQAWRLYALGNVAHGGAR